MDSLSGLLPGWVSVIIISVLLVLLLLCLGILIWRKLGKETPVSEEELISLVDEAHEQGVIEENEAEIADDARLELAVEQGRHFITGNPYRLKVTVKDAQPGEEYYIYFPYEKNALHP